MSNQQDLDLSMLDMNLEDIPDLPGFEVPSAGEYNLRLKAEVKMVNEKIAVEVSYEVIDCIRKNDDADPDAAPGTKFSQLFFLQGKPEGIKISLGKLKELLSGVAEQKGEGNLLILVRDHLADAVVTATVKRRADKEDKEKFYPDVKNMKLA